MTPRDFVHRGFGGAAVPGDIAPLVVLTISRDEAAAVAAPWADLRLVADHYAWQVWTGRHRGIPLTACSTGTGSASAAIAIEELAILGARTLLGVGPVRDGRRASGVLVADGAYRGDAASHGYARAGFPAAAHVEVVMAAVAAGRAAGLRLVHGIVADSDAEADDPAARACGAVPVHGSPATLLVQGAVHGLRTGFLAADGTLASQAALRQLAVATLAQLAAWDGGSGGGPTGFDARLAAIPVHRPAQPD